MTVRMKRAAIAVAGAGLIALLLVSLLYLLRPLTPDPSVTTPARAVPAGVALYYHFPSWGELGRRVPLPFLRGEAVAAAERDLATLAGAPLSSSDGPLGVAVYRDTQVVRRLFVLRAPLPAAAPIAGGSEEAPYRGVAVQRLESGAFAVRFGRFLLRADSAEIIKSALLVAARRSSRSLQRDRPYRTLVGTLPGGFCAYVSPPLLAGGFLPTRGPYNHLAILPPRPGEKEWTVRAAHAAYLRAAAPRAPAPSNYHLANLLSLIPAKAELAVVARDVPPRALAEYVFSGMFTDRRRRKALRDHYRSIGERVGFDPIEKLSPCLGSEVAFAANRPGRTSDRGLARRSYTFAARLVRREEAVRILKTLLRAIAPSGELQQKRYLGKEIYFVHYGANTTPGFCAVGGYLVFCTDHRRLKENVLAEEGRLQSLFRSDAARRLGAERIRGADLAFVFPGAAGFVGTLTKRDETSAEGRAIPTGKN